MKSKPYVIAIRGNRSAPQDWAAALARLPGVMEVQASPRRAAFRATDEGLAAVQAAFADACHIETVAEREPQSAPAQPLPGDRKGPREN